MASLSTFNRRQPRYIAMQQHCNQTMNGGSAFPIVKTRRCFLPLINWSRNEPFPPSWNNRALAYISFVFAYYFPPIRLSEAVCNCLPEWVMKVNIYRSIDSTNEMDCGRERSLSCSVHECNWRIWKQRRFICILVSVWNVCSAQCWVFPIQLILSHSHSLHKFFLNSECIHLCMH